MMTGKFVRMPRVRVVEAGGKLYVRTWHDRKDVVKPTDDMVARRVWLARNKAWKCRSESSCLRAKSRVRYLCDANRDRDGQYFVTATFWKDVTYEEAVDCHKRFVRVLKGRFGKSFGYVGVFEVTKNGRIHIHYLMYGMMGYVDYLDVTLDWTNAVKGVIGIGVSSDYVRCETDKIRSRGGVVHYIAKYVTKSSMDWAPRGKKIFVSGGCVIKPVACSIGWDDEDGIGVDEATAAARCDYGVTRLAGGRRVTVEIYDGEMAEIRRRMLSVANS